MKGVHLRHLAAEMGEVSGGPTSDRMTASDVEQKLRVPVLLLTGVATTTYSTQGCILQVVVMVKRYPDLMHHTPAVHPAPPSVESIRLPCREEIAFDPLGSGPRVAKS